MDSFRIQLWKPPFGAKPQKLAGERLERASHSMSLEAQALSPEGNEEMFSEMVENLIDESPKQLWD